MSPVNFLMQICGRYGRLMMYNEVPLTMAYIPRCGLHRLYTARHHHSNAETPVRCWLYDMCIATLHPNPPLKQIPLHTLRPNPNRHHQDAMHHHPRSRRVTSLHRMGQGRTGICGRRRRNQRREVSLLVVMRRSIGYD